MIYVLCKHFITLCIQLQHAISEEELECLFDTPEFKHLLELSGSRRIPSVSLINDQAYMHDCFL